MLSITADKLIENFRNDKKFRTKLEKGIIDSGILLEEQARLIFSKFDFSHYHTHYTEKRNDKDITKEIDINAFKEISVKTDIENFNSSFNTAFIGECKYSSRDDRYFFVTQPLDKSLTRQELISIPVTINGQIFLPLLKQANALTFFAFQNNINTEGIIVSDRVTVLENTKIINPEQVKARDGKEDSLFTFCEEQVLPAVEYNYDKAFSHLETMYKFLRNMTEYFTTTAYIREKDYRKELNNLYFIVQSIIPIVVTNREILTIDYEVKKTETGFDNKKTKEVGGLKEDEIKIKNLKKVNYFIYQHKPKEPERFPKTLSGRWSQSIIVCHIDNLEKCIEFIMNNFIDYFKQDLEINLKGNLHLFDAEIKEYYKKYKDWFNIVA
ncbi:hypothetical protein GOV04_05080 [Candidatus Woesearchaeota archaeon]|nr:hypothetical protein [Candidatus Woesearchaeota archaeon]